MSISQELEQKIHETINALVEQNIKPTYEAIRGEGGYSFNSIKPALKSWRENKDAAGEPSEKKTAEIAVDEELKEVVLANLEAMVTDLLITVTSQAQEKASETLNLERAAHDDTVKNLKSEVSDLEDYIQKTDAESEQLKADKAKIEQENADLVATVEQLTNDNKSLNRDIENVKNDNATLKSNNQSLTTNLTKANAEKSMIIEQSDKQKIEIEKLSKQFDDLQIKSNEQLTQIAQLKGEINGFDKSDKQLRSELENLKARHDDYVTQIATLKEQNKQLSSDVDDFQLAQQTDDDIKVSEDKKTDTTRKTSIKK